MYVLDEKGTPIVLVIVFQNEFGCLLLISSELMDGVTPL